MMWIIDCLIAVILLFVLWGRWYDTLRLDHDWIDIAIECIASLCVLYCIVCMFMGRFK